MDLNPDNLLGTSKPFLIGALGGLVALRVAPGESWAVRAVNVLSGSLMAGFISPAACEFFALTSPAMQGAMSFAVGLFGMNVASVAVVWIKTMQLSDVLPWVRRKE